ncbi:MAG: hypothetical protein JWL83_3179 [Actinomycetia bacterium]|nr:hypothetical protein [Actinomycetes bacterium]
MFHVVTVHWRSDAWIVPQLQYLRRHLPAGTRVYAALHGVDRKWFGEFDWAGDLDGTHAEKLNQLAAIVSRDAAPDDHLVFVDGDAFPIATVDASLLVTVPLVAVCRAENLGDPQPHPCFCVTTLACWNEIAGDWRPGHTWVNSEGETVTDVGGNLLAALERHGVSWRPLLRSNRVDLHPLWFAVYGDLVYHHGAGFRERISRIDGIAETNPRLAAARSRVPNAVPVLGRLERAMRYRIAAAKRERWLAHEGAAEEQLAHDIYEQLLVDDQFYRRFTEPRTTAAGA